MQKLRAICQYTAIQLAKKVYPTLFADIPKRAIVLSEILLKNGILAKSAAEIGVWRGHSSIGFLRLLPSLEKFILVDSWTQYPDYTTSGDNKAHTFLLQDKLICEDRVYFFNNKIEILPQLSLEAASKIADRSLDFIFIDANHSYEYVKQDILVWRPKVKQGGLLAGHDIDLPNFPGVRKAVEETIRGNWYLGEDAIWWTIVKD